MQLDLLDEKHPEYRANVEIWRQCSALYHGGQEFEDLIEYFLPQNPEEPADVYAKRKRESSYRSYLAPICDYFVAWLFSGQFYVRAKKAGTGEPVDPDPYYSEFQEDVGGDLDLVDFLKERLTQALIKGKSYWLLEMPYDGQPPPKNRAEWESRKLGNAKLCKIDREDIVDWDVDDHGKLVWCSIHSVEQVRKDFTSKRNLIRETWCVYDSTKVDCYQLEYEKGKRPRDKKTNVPLVYSRPHGFKEVPLVCLDAGDGMWIGSRVKASQIEHFRLTSANSWLIKRTCYAMPVIKMVDDGRPPKMGSGYYIKIGIEESFEWSSPKNTPFDIISREIQHTRDEIYRVVHQMAQGLDNNAETVGRSADSKEIDTASTRIMLNAYGSIVRKSIEETYEILSDAREEPDVFWSVEGLNGFDTATAGQLIATAQEAQLLGIPSKTFRKEVKIKSALAMLPDVDHHVKEKIKKEIADAIDQHGDIDEMTFAPEQELQLELQKQKDETALTIQDIKSQDVRMEVSMASGGKLGQEAVQPPDGKSPVAPKAPAKGGISKKAINLIKADA